MCKCRQLEEGKRRKLSEERNGKSLTVDVNDYFFILFCASEQTDTFVVERMKIRIFQNKKGVNLNVVSRQIGIHKSFFLQSEMHS